MIFPHLTRLLWIFFALLISACSTTPPAPQQSTNWIKHQANLEQITNFKVTGKIGYKSIEQRHSLNFIWIQKPKNSELLLTTFLGQTVLKVTLSQGKTIIETGDNQTFEGTDSSQLIYHLTGLNIPIDYLGDWMKGLPTEADNYKLNQINTVADLSKEVGTSLWHLNYNSYLDKNNILLPKSMTLTQQDVTIKIIASNWIILK